MQQQSSSPHPENQLDDLEEDLFEGITKDEIEELVDEAGKLGSVELTAPGLVALLKSIANLTEENAELRAEYPSEPSKFQSSEEDLFEKLKVLEQLAALPTLLETFLAHKGYEGLLLLFAHQNPDIVNQALHILVELSDPESEIVTQAPDGLAHLDLLISSGVEEALQDVFQQWSKNIKVFFSALHLLQNIIYLKPERVRPIFKERGPMVKAVMVRLCSKESPLDIKLYSAEIVSNLLQDESNAKQFIPQLSKLLEIINGYRKNKLEDDQIIEIVENIADGVSSVLLAGGQEEFGKLEGVELMVACLRGPRPIRKVGIKILHFALNEHAKNTERLLEADGIKFTFGFLMRESKLTSDGRQFANIREELFSDQEHVLFILACLVSHLEGVKLDRVVYKFKEEKCEKVHRLVAMFGVYLEREEAPQEEEEEGGRGQQLQLLAFILGYLAIQKQSSTVARATVKGLAARGIPLKAVEFWVKKYGLEFGGSTGLELDVVGGDGRSVRGWVQRVGSELAGLRG